MWLNSQRGARVDLPLALLLIADLLLFAGGATAHAGVPIPLGIGTWVEPLLVPAAVVEGAGAVGLLLALGATMRGAHRASGVTWWVLWYCFAGVLWGMGRLAIGSIPEAHTMSNDFLHIGMTLITTLALVRLAGLRSGEACQDRKPRRPRIATIAALVAGAIGNAAGRSPRSMIDPGP
jgi:hypothetical protein